MTHHSFDYPDFNAEIQLVRLNSQHFVSIDPAEMYSKPEVKDLTISTRKCIFSDEADKVLYANVKERNLTFIEYSYHNCLAECRATFFDTSWPEMNQNLPKTTGSIEKAPCGCIPDCSLYYYPIESSFGTLDTTVYYTGGSFSKNPR
ncbi:Sodium channel protein Nach [Temnothorax longispinosus]|uniref:Sodium channel protein Nach n=1 Tax=Temnothorax longispinosus TaxID=300112 RepID=A0A4S2KJE5_9HYME|nr:Sodium channel protein Nach [Temnothorax longispinosus]